MWLDDYQRIITSRYRDLCAEPDALKRLDIAKEIAKVAKKIAERVAREALQPQGRCRNVDD